MEAHEAVGAGIAAAALGELYYSPLVLRFSAFEAALTVVIALGLGQAAAGFAARDPWGVGVGAGVAALAGLRNFDDVLVGSVSPWAVAGALEGLGLLLLAAAVGGWALARSDRNPDEERLDEDHSLLAFRAACGVAAASGLVYFAANVTVGDPLFLPGNLLVAGGFSLAAFAADLPLLEADPAGREPAGGRPS